MTLNRAFNMIAGFFVLASSLLGYFVSPYFLFFTAFVGFMLLQSSITGWCPGRILLSRMGLSDRSGKVM
jgi:hypothetical protein